MDQKITGRDIRKETRTVMSGRFFSFFGAILVPTILGAIVSMFASLLLTIVGLNEFTLGGVIVFRKIVSVLIDSYVLFVIIKNLHYLITHKGARLDFNNMFTIDSNQYWQLFFYQIIIGIISTISTTSMNAKIITTQKWITDNQSILSDFQGNRQIIGDWLRSNFLETNFLFFTLITLLITLFISIFLMFVNYFIILDSDDILTSIKQSIQSVLRNLGTISSVLGYIFLLAIVFGIFVVALVFVAFIVPPIIIAILFVSIVFIVWFAIYIRTLLVVLFIGINNRDTRETENEMEEIKPELIQDDEEDPFQL